jgi:hypothetical protein
MSKDRREQPEAPSSIIPQREAAAENTAKQADKEKAEKLYAPPKREARPAKLTAEQYLKTANVNGGIGGLVRSMHGAKIMPFAEWEALTGSLRKKQVK